MFLPSVHPADDWARVSTPARHFLIYISTTDQDQDLAKHAVLCHHG